MQPPNANSPEAMGKIIAETLATQLGDLRRDMTNALGRLEASLALLGTISKESATYHWDGVDVKQNTTVAYQPGEHAMGVGVAVRDMGLFPFLTVTTLDNGVPFGGISGVVGAGAFYSVTVDGVQWKFGCLPLPRMGATVYVSVPKDAQEATTVARVNIISLTQENTLAWCAKYP